MGSGGAALSHTVPHSPPLHLHFALHSEISFRKGRMHSSVPWIVTVTSAKLYSSTTGAGALAKLSPRTPVSILLYDVGGQPDAVTFKAVLQGAKTDVVSCCHQTILSSDIMYVEVQWCIITFPFPHMVPSMGGPFLVLQKKGLSGWLHHSCLHGSNVRYCGGTKRNSFLQSTVRTCSAHTGWPSVQNKSTIMSELEWD